MKKKTAIIVGVGGQDGRILRDSLKSKNYNIIGISKDKNIYFGIKSYIKSTNILDHKKVDDMIKKYRPDEIYYLAAYHHSSQDKIPSDDILYKESTDIHVNGYLNILQAISKYSIKTKVCYASSCLIYGGSDTKKQNEETLPVPNSIYAITKLEGMHLGNYFANKYNLKIVNAILYNHESEFRGPNFVSIKVIKGAINISKGLQDKIILGDLSTKVDRGYAGDYVKAMHGLLVADKKGDYIISSGSLHTIQDLVEIVFGYLGLDWKKYVITDQNIIQRKKGLLFGDNGKIMKDIKWRPNLGFKEMVISIIINTIPFIGI